MCLFFTYNRNPNCVRQLSVDAITPEASTPSGSHVSPLAQKPSNDATKRSGHSQQIGNLVGDINVLALDSNNSQKKTSQQQSRGNQTASTNQNSGTTSNTNGNCAQPASANWQQTTSPNGTVKTIENSAGK